MTIRTLPAFLKPFFNGFRPQVSRREFKYLWALMLALVLNLRTSKLVHLVRLLPFSSHRTRHGAFLASDRWQAPVMLTQAVGRLLGRLKPRPGETIDLILDDHRTAKRARKMDRISKIWDHKDQRFVYGHILLTAAIVFRGMILPIRISLWKPKGQPGPRYKKLTVMAAEVIRDFVPPPGVKVRVLFDAFYLCPTVVKACEARGWTWFSVAAKNRSFQPAGKKGVKARKIGDLAPGLIKHQGRNVRMPRARGTATLRIACVEGHLSRIGRVRMVLSKRPSERWKTTVAIVTNATNIDARGIVSIYERRWKIEVLFKELEQDLGLGEYQMLKETAIVHHLHLCCLAHLLLTHRSIDALAAQAMEPHNEVCLPPLRQRIESLRREIRNDQIRRLFARSACHERTVKKLELFLQAA
jgi:hypothetical protein